MGNGIHEQSGRSLHTNLYIELRFLTAHHSVAA